MQRFIGSKTDPWLNCNGTEGVTLCRERIVDTYWLLQARRRFDVEILNYTITSNHVHLIVRGRGGDKGIPGLMQLVAGRTG